LYLLEDSFGQDFRVEETSRIGRSAGAWWRGEEAREIKRYSSLLSGFDRVNRRQNAVPAESALGAQVERRSAVVDCRYRRPSRV
jgi:hypothetical protein